MEWVCGKYDVCWWATHVLEECVGARFPSIGYVCVTE